jgi:hypothetical protein
MQQKSLNYQVFNIFENYGKLILAIVIFASLLAGYYFFIKPSFEKMNSENSQRISELKMSIDRAEKTKAMLVSFLGGYSKLDPKEIQRIAKMLPEDDNYVALLPHIEYLVLRKGYALQSVQVNRIESADTLEKAPDQPGGKGDASMRVNELIKNHIGIMKINFSATGANYDGFKSLLADLENNLRLMDVEVLSYDPTSKSSQFTITAYYWR